MQPVVQLCELDDAALEQLVLNALSDTDIGEVMPSTAGPTSWNSLRVQEFLAFHESRRGGLDGPVGEVSFVVRVDDLACGVVRLERISPERLEVGMWLTRSARGRGIGGQVLAAAADKAVAFGARTLLADTSAHNVAALAVLLRAGARLDAPTPEGRVRAEIDLVGLSRLGAQREWHASTNRAYVGVMADNSWNVAIGTVDDPGDTGVPPVPTTVYEGDDSGARAAFDEWSAKAQAAESKYRYVMLRQIGEVVELWGTPPAVA